jgi:aspartyl-tRNA(Asn)/glutamyl-tRNA(Gln) amidotransferase subunit A
MDPATFSAAEIPEKVRSGEVPASAVIEATLERIQALNPSLGAFLTVTEDRARKAAKEIDRAVIAGEDPGPLAGIPVAIKDNICTEGVATTAGSRILEGHVPIYDATVVSKLWSAGAVLVGKTNLDEFGMGSSNENSGYGPARNPWDPERVPGGSSGGSAVAVAAGMAGLCLGSDTGGSIRQPAAFCGVYGLLPTYGRVSRYGLMAFASSLDQIGGFARDPESLALLYRAISGHDQNDSTSAEREVEPVSPEDGVNGLTVGFASSLMQWEGIEPEVAAATQGAADALARSGASLTDAELPDPAVGIAAYYLLATAEASSNLARYDGVRYGMRVPGGSLEEMYRETRSAGFGPEVKRRIMLGTYALSAGYYTSPTTAFRLGDRVEEPLAMYLADVFTVFANLGGLPAISIPAGTDLAGLPIGVQLLAPRWREDLLFRAARALEQEQGPVPPPNPVSEQP